MKHQGYFEHSYVAEKGAANIRTECELWALAEGFKEHGLILPSSFVGTTL